MSDQRSRDLLALVARHSSSDRALEMWLRALYHLAVTHGSSELTRESFLRLLDEAFTSAPVAFNHEWAKIVDPPDTGQWLHMLRHRPVEPDGTPGPIEGGYDYALNVLKFQIADLRRINPTVPHSPATSASGHFWYNLTPQAVLECGAEGMADRESPMVWDWAALGELLETGRIYE